MDLSRMTLFGAFIACLLPTPACSCKNSSVGDEKRLPVVGKVTLDAQALPVPKSRYVPKSQLPGPWGHRETELEKRHRKTKYIVYSMPGVFEFKAPGEAVLQRFRFRDVHSTDIAHGKIGALRLPKGNTLNVKRTAGYSVVAGRKRKQVPGEVKSYSMTQKINAGHSNTLYVQFVGQDLERYYQWTLKHAQAFEGIRAIQPNLEILETNGILNANYEVANKAQLDNMLRRVAKSGQTKQYKAVAKDQAGKMVTRANMMMQRGMKQVALSLMGIESSHSLAKMIDVNQVPKGDPFSGRTNTSRGNIQRIFANYPTYEAVIAMLKTLKFPEVEGEMPLGGLFKNGSGVDGKKVFNDYAKEASKLRWWKKRLEQIPALVGQINAAIAAVVGNSKKEEL